MASEPLAFLSSLIGSGLVPSAEMDNDELSLSDSPAPEIASDDAQYDAQLLSLQTYIDSVPYACESVEEMHAKLEEIVGKIVICIEAKNWLVLTTWDGLLQWQVIPVGLFN
jgi:proteasome activator subunit 4